MGYVMKGAPFLRTLGLAFCRLAITDEVASELLFSFGLESLDVSFCAQITDTPFQASPSSLLRELVVTSTQISDAAIEQLASRAPQLEVFSAGLVMKLTDRGVQALSEGCSRLRMVCVRNTQVTDACFSALVRCRHLEHLDASWCLRATSRAIEILAAADPRPPLKELVLDHLGALSLDLGIDCLGMLPPPASPALGLWDLPPGKAMLGSTSSPMPLHWLPTRLPPEPPSLFLPPPAQALPPLALGPGPPPMGGGLSCWDELGPHEAISRSSSAGRSVWNQGQVDSPTLPHAPWTAPEPAAPPPSLTLLVQAYASSLEQLFLDGIRDVADAAALEAIAAVCPQLHQLALTLPAARDTDTALEAALRSVGAKCVRLSVLRLDSSARSHRAVVAPLAPPYFARLRSLTLWCSAKGGGLLDSELEAILSGRSMLETLSLRNCEGLSEGLFPRWCNRGERYDEAEAVEQLDQALLSSLNFGSGVHMPALIPVLSPRPDPPRISYRRQHPRCPPALALRSVTNFSLGGATSLSDRSADALAELLHDAQTVDLRGSPQLSEDALRSFRKGCRFIRSVVIVTRDRTLSWTAATSAVKRRHHRRSSFHTSGSSGTESS